VVTRRDLEAVEARLTGTMERRFADWGRTVIYANLGADRHRAAGLRRRPRSNPSPMVAPSMAYEAGVVAPGIS
jgi:hypothetical protein